jgi:hypothetical protein
MFFRRRDDGNNIPERRESCRRFWFSIIRHAAIAKQWRAAAADGAREAVAQVDIKRVFELVSNEIAP